MRSTIFTSLMLATQAAAQGGPMLGCYARDYGADHLARNPDQVVSRMVLRVRPEGMGTGATVAEMAVWTANQGHVVKTGHQNRRFDQFLYCWAEGKATSCGVECDGGTFRIERDDGDTLQFVTDYLMVGSVEDCGGAIDLAEHPRQPVSYRLTRAPAALCEREFGR